MFEQQHRQRLYSEDSYIDEVISVLSTKYCSYIITKMKEDDQDKCRCVVRSSSCSLIVVRCWNIHYLSLRGAGLPAQIYDWVESREHCFKMGQPGLLLWDHKIVESALTSLVAHVPFESLNWEFNITDLFHWFLSAFQSFKKVWINSTSISPRS